MKRILTVLFLGLNVSGVMAQPVLASESSGFKEVSIQELDGIVAAKNATIIDVNSAKSYTDGHIPGAVSFAKAKANLADVLPKDKSALIVAYCGGPLCTAWEEAAAKAKQLGYSNIKHFKGGIKVWKEAGKSVEKAT